MFHEKRSAHESGGTAEKSGTESVYKPGSVLTILRIEATAISLGQALPPDSLATYPVTPNGPFVSPASSRRLPPYLALLQAGFTKLIPSPI